MVLSASIVAHAVDYRVLRIGAERHSSTHDCLCLAPGRSVYLARDEPAGHVNDNSILGVAVEFGRRTRRDANVVDAHVLVLE